MHNSVESSHGQTVVEGAGNEFFSEAEARKQSWVTLGILALAGLVTVGGAWWCSADGARERGAMIRDLEKISNFESEGRLPSTDSLKTATRTLTHTGE